MFYLRLAANNIRANKRIFVPFLIATTFLTVMNVVMMTSYFSANSMFQQSSDSTQAAAAQLFMFGAMLMAGFSVIIAWYANSFLLKQRTRQLATYNVIGFGKMGLWRMVTGELFLSFIVTVVLGSVFGAAFSRLTYLLLRKILYLPQSLNFGINPVPILLTVVLMLAIFIWLLILDSIWLARHRPIEMLRDASAGEREPKTRWLMLIFGILTLGAGYTIAIAITKPLAAFQYFLIAVALVIVGTYALFIAGSVFIFKWLRKRKHYYYQPAHFINTSNMIHRMRQNGTGLASIAVLATMTLVTLATTFTLYAGVDQIVKIENPADVSYMLWMKRGKPVHVKTVNRFVAQTAVKHHVTLNKRTTIIKEGTQPTVVTQNRIRKATNADYVHLTGPADGMSSTDFLTFEHYKLIRPNAKALAANEVLFATSNPQRPQTLHFGKLTYHVRSVKMLPYVSQNPANPTSLLVFANVKQLLRATDQIGIKTTKQEQPLFAQTFVYLDVSGTQKNQRAFTTALQKSRLATKGQLNMPISRATSRLAVLQWMSSFLFMGILLGLMFIMSTALILYYKQISEGLADVKRYAVLQQVGLSRDEVKRTINSQLLTLFYVPLVVAAIHTFVAAPFVHRILTMFGLSNGRFYLEVIGVTLAVFALVYILIYRATSNVYFRIVSGAKRQ